MEPHLAQEAARQLEAEGKSIEVIDLRSIAPLDEDLIAESVRKTNRVLVAHEDSLTMGFGAEVAARIAENCFEYRDAPVRRIADSRRRYGVGDFSHLQDYRLPIS